MKYPVVIERTKRNYSAYCPDHPGCVATGRTSSETMKRMRRAIAMHLAGLREDRLPIPKPSTSVSYITVAA
jgi:predicted RNase H-like HicB family nuclease